MWTKKSQITNNWSSKAFSSFYYTELVENMPREVQRGAESYRIERQDVKCGSDILWTDATGFAGRGPLHAYLPTFLSC